MSCQCYRSTCCKPSRGSGLPDNRQRLLCHRSCHQLELSRSILPGYLVTRHQSREPLPSTEPNVDQLLALSENELYLLLGREITREAATPQGAGFLVKRGKEFFSEEYVSLRAAICGPDGPRAAVGSVTNTTLAASLVNAIVGGSHMDVSHLAALYIAVIVLRTGLNNFCGDDGT
jgi:hypothetical protein